MTGATRPRRGRGSGVYKTVRWLMSAGTGACSGKLQLKSWPAPSEWKGQAGTITVQIDTGKTIAYPIIVTGFGPDYNEEKMDEPEVSFTWEITGEPTYAGWGDGAQPAATDPSKSDQIQWEGSRKTYDPNGLQDSADVLVDVWGTLADTDAAETAKLVAVITATAAPMTNQKKRTATYQRDALDGGTITIGFGLTDTAEDVVNPRTQTTTDPQKIQTGGSVAAINATPTIPTISGQTVVSRGDTTSEINDQKALHVTAFGQRSTADDITMPGRYNRVDVSDLQSTGVWTDLYAAGGSAPSAPSPTDNLQIVSSEIVSENLDIKRKVYTLAKDTPKQAWEQSHSYSVSDANTLGSVAQSAAIDDSTPDAPSDTNLVKRTQRVELVTHDHIGYIDDYGLRTTTEDITFPNTWANVDPLGIETTGKTTEVYTTTGGVPSDPSVVSGTQIVRQRTLKENRIKSVRETEFSVLNSEQERTYPKTRTTDDANNVADDALRSKFWTVGGSAPSAPDDVPSNNVKLIDFTDVPVTPTRNLRVWAYGAENSKDKLVNPHNHTDVDPSALQSEAMRAALDGDSISDPAGYVLRNTYTRAITVGLGTNRTLTVKTYGLQTTAQDITLPRTRASWNWESENRYTVADIIDDGGTVATVRNALVALYGNDVTSESIEVEEVRPGKFLRTYTTVTEEVIVKFAAQYPDSRYEIGYVDGSGDVYVYVARITAIGADLYEGIIQPTCLDDSIIIFFTITRRVTGGTLPMHYALRGKTNNATFLGLPAGAVKFFGPSDGTAKVDSSGDAIGVNVITYLLTADSRGWFTMGDCPAGPFQLDGLGSYVSNRGAWLKASDLGFSSAPLPTGDFSVFIT